MKEVERPDNKSSKAVNESKNDPAQKPIDNAAENDAELKELVEDFVDDLIADNTPKTRVDPEGKTNVTEYFDLSKQLLGVTKAFPGFDAEIQDIAATAAMVVMNIRKYNRTKLYLADLEGADDHRYLVDDPEVKRDMKNLHNDMDKLFERIEAQYTAEKYPVQNRLLQLVKNHSRLLRDPKYLDNISGHTRYLRNLGRSMLDMPSPEFTTDRKAPKKYKVDLKKYQEFMEKYAFLPQIEDKQNFFMNVYLPYNEKLENGTATPEDNINYTKAYTEHLARQKSYFEEIVSYNHSDPLIAANKTCNDSGQFIQDWTGPRFGKINLNQISIESNFLAKGWPAADIQFLLQLNKMKSDLDSAVSGETSNYSEEQVERAREIKAKFDYIYEQIQNNDLTSIESREDYLRELEEPVTSFAEMMKEYRDGLAVDGKEVNAEHSILWQFKEAMERPVSAEELRLNEEAREMYSDGKEFEDFEDRLAKTKKQRDQLFKDAEGRYVKDISHLSEEELEAAADLYDELFEPIFNRNNVRDYRYDNPGITELDFFMVGNVPLKDYIGKEKLSEIMAEDNGDELLQAEIVRLATDLTVPFSVTTIRKDYNKGIYRKTALHNIFDKEEKERIIIEKPYLEEASSYRKWFEAQYPQMNTEGLTDSDWFDMYQTELRLTVERGLLKPENITSKEELLRETNEDIPSEMGMQYIYNLYGSEPKFISDFAGNVIGEGKIYTVEQFKENLSPVDSGSFSNKEFALMAFLAASDPDLWWS